MPYADKIELLAEHMHMDVQVERPYFDLLFAEWISMYVRWCLDNDAACRGRAIADWECDFDRAAWFFAHVEAMRQRGEMPSAMEGSGRHDMDLLSQPVPDRLELPLPRLDGSTPARVGWWRRLLGKGR